MPIVIAILVVLIGWGAIWLTQQVYGPLYIPIRRGAPPPPCRRAPSLVSIPLRRFYRDLKAALGEQYLVFLRVPVGALVQVENPQHDRRPTWVSATRQTVDLVLAQPDTLAPVMAIDMDSGAAADGRRWEDMDLRQQVFKKAELPY